MTVRKIILSCLIFILFLSASAYSKDRVAVLDFEAKEIELSDALSISDLFRSDLVATNLFTVLERSNMETVLSEHELQMSGIINNTSAVEIGELLSVDYLFLGNLSKFGNKYILVIDKINVETGEIEQSVKKTSVNIDSFFELSAEAAMEMSGSTEASPAAKDGFLPYKAETLTQMFTNINLFQLSSLEIETKRMQATDVPLRRGLYDESKKEDALLNAGLNLISFGIAGSFIQGFDEYAWTCVGTTGLVAAAWILTPNNTILKTSTGILFLASWLVSLGIPFYYESEYNKNLEEKLLVF